MNSLKIMFKNDRGHELSARLELPEGKPDAYAIFAHCFTCDKNLNAARNISNALTNQNIAVLLFDFTGLGESAGEFAESNFSSNIRDLISASAFLTTSYEAPSLLVGHSLGGTAVLSVAGFLPSVKAVATIGAPFDAAHVLLLFKNSLNEINDLGQAEVDLGGRIFTIKKQFLEDIGLQHLEGLLPKLNKALLILHSPQDSTVSIENASAIYRSAKHPKSFISLNGADHLLSRKQQSVYAGSLIATWVQNYLTGQ
ncbi:alpha/beta hydrolase family protein [Mucilaginibacter polytrichastri]|uniref:Serine aminopeptidase S33 domain-containing protein n=1 Tax=Mucilaginibacter polytrichastri TaxID=1302689 RepID=A0A1Q6A1Z9_9SPHI|nr:alpha/beta hydrolase [Mucilaginibacter polytrichastri]OKS88044.1 hypothetical protein RG47T_3508 [Mucilaginibacter polytrichastri]SFT10237.1 putative redox protein [Mucilaginibacter polytrichastri]